MERRRSQLESGLNCIDFLFPSRHALQRPAFSSFFLLCIIYFGLSFSFFFPFSFFYFLPSASCISLFFSVYSKRKNLGDYNPSTTFKPCMEFYFQFKIFPRDQKGEWLLLSSSHLFPSPVIPSPHCPIPALT